MRFYRKKKCSLTNDNVYAACLRKLNYRDYSLAELQEYLAEQEDVDPEVAEEILAELEELGFINDRRFAKALYNGWLDGSLKGKYQLIRKLYKYRIEEDIINEYLALDTADIEIERATEAVKKYLRSRNLDIFADRIKILNYLKNQYYMPNIINKALARVLNDVSET